MQILEGESQLRNRMHKNVPSIISVCQAVLIENAPDEEQPSDPNHNWCHKETRERNFGSPIGTGYYRIGNHIPDFLFCERLLVLFGGAPGSGPPTPSSAQLIRTDLASGHKSAYIFNITNCVRASNAGTDYVKGYRVPAVSDAAGKTGVRRFCGEQNGGSSQYNPLGGTN